MVLLDLRPNREYHAPKVKKFRNLEEKEIKNIAFV